MEKLTDLYKLKVVKETGNSLRESTNKFFTMIMKDNLVTNPVEIETLESLVMLKVRESRTKILNILNAMRNYQRNIDLDLRVINGCEFKFKMDDSFLINSNKQVLENFEKQLKDNDTLSAFSANKNGPTLKEDFTNTK